MTDIDPAAVRPPRRRGWLLWPALLVGSWMLWNALTFATSLRAYSVPTGSMSPTIAPGDRVAVAAEAGAVPRRGEIWIFHMPPASRLVGSDAVKRVIGLPGDTVEVAGGQVLVNGEALDEPYLCSPTAYVMAPLTLAPGEYFVLGDSRNNSNDSHLWGPVPADHLVGRVQVRYWPLRRAGKF